MDLLYPARDGGDAWALWAYPCSAYPKLHHGGSNILFVLNLPNKVQKWKSQFSIFKSDLGELNLHPRQRGKEDFLKPQVDDVKKDIVGFFDKAPLDIDHNVPVRSKMDQESRWRLRSAEKERDESTASPDGRRRRELEYGSNMDQESRWRLRSAEKERDESTASPDGRRRRELEYGNVAQDVPARLHKSDLHALNLSAESNLSFKALVTTNETDDSVASNTHQGREPAINWGSTNSPYLSCGLDDPNSSYPYLPPVLEEPSSSFSESADDDPVPGIEGLQISGDAFPGRELQACGYSINGAKQPKYLVTADDVDSYLAIEVHPLDDRKRKASQTANNPEFVREILKAGNQSGKKTLAHLWKLDALKSEYAHPKYSEQFLEDTLFSPRSLPHHLSSPPQ
ncbi:hypothetical protein KSP40_PGU002061 [Platanthera guangdongensis]|uniref:Uncharacterized protein n=1 Tax=Platanthera guangdongensis TaxID=2320717 RepID=A0ABR2MR95_9ASPA